MKRLWNSFNIAVAMFSRLPAAQADWSEENMKYMMCFFPWIGIPIGLLCFGWHHLALWLGLNMPMHNIILMLIPLLVTGGIHLDGMLDTADALSSWRPIERRLEILKDSHAGAFAIIICCAYFALLYAVTDMVSDDMFLVYPFIFIISRSFSGFSVVSFKKASTEGTVAGFAKNAQTRIIQVTEFCYIAAAAVIMFFLSPVYAAAVLIGAAGTFLWYYRMAMKNFNGINGDLAGCFLSVAELVMPFAMVVASLIMQKMGI